MAGVTECGRSDLGTTYWRSGLYRERCYISSLPGDAKQLLWAVRAHWRVENSLQWVLDIAFREDESRVSNGHGPENLATMTQMALNLLRREASSKGGVKA